MATTENSLTEQSPEVLAAARALVADQSRFDAVQLRMLEVMMASLPAAFHVPLYVAVRERKFSTMEGAREFARAGETAYRQLAEAIERAIALVPGP